MCGAHSIQVLSLNGLAAAPDCSNAIVFPFSGVTLFNTIGGTLPPCVWFLANLTVLHATGNGLAGTLSGRIPAYSKISDLSLAHNKITGSIPMHIHLVQKVDLSYNQLSGVLEDFEAVGQANNNELYLEINRLSGDLPVAQLQNMQSENLKILRGNMFACGHIPENDDFADDYICGSADLDEALDLFAFSAVVVSCTMLVVLLSMAVGRSPRFIAFKELHSEEEPSAFVRFVAATSLLRVYMHRIELLRGSDDPTLQWIVNFVEKLKATSKLCVHLLVAVLVMSIPIYAIRRYDHDAFTTHTHAYSWFWTLAYMHGVLPATLILLSWMVAMTLFFYHVKLSTAIPSDPAAVEERERSRPTSSRGVSALKGRLLLVVVSAMNLAVAITVNSLYMYGIQQPMPSSILFGVQSSLAVFRLAYSYCVLPLLAKSIDNHLMNIVFQFRLACVNNFLVPCLVTAFASPSCFQVILLFYLIQ
jgi:hypothetical protein